MSNRVICVVKGHDEPDKYLIRRIIQFSYLEGAKRDRQFSIFCYVDLAEGSTKL